MDYSIVLSSLSGESQPLFSVVIPCHNAAKYFSETLDSLVAQTLQDFEVMIVDDFSKDTDELLTVVQNYSDRLNITLVRTSKNINGAAARNLGVALSQGRYIAFLDADDLFLPNKLEVCFAALSNSGTDTSILYSQLMFKNRYSNNFEIRPKYAKTEAQSVGEYLFKCNGLMQTSTLVMSRKLFEQIEFNPLFKRHQDYDFVLRAAAMKFNFLYVDMPLAIWHKPEKRGTTTITKGASTEYSIYWLKQMSAYLSPAEKALYSIKVTAPLAILEGEFRMSFKIYLKNIGKVPVKASLSSFYQSAKNLVKWIYAR